MDELHILYFLPIIVGTSRCHDFELYKKVVNGEVANLSTASKDLFPPGNGQANHGLVNWIVNISMYTEDSPWPVIDSRYDIHYQRMATSDILQARDNIGEHLKPTPPDGVPFDAVLRTDFTRMILMQSDMDLNTPPGPAWDIYDAIDAKKYLLHFKHHTHDGYNNPCTKDFRLAAMGGKSLDSIDTKACEQKGNEFKATSWALRKSLEYSS